ncbi:MAG: hypothetical protein WBL63_10675 [Candidatus Acidiferrum sp.]
MNHPSPLSWRGQLARMLSAQVRGSLLLGVLVGMLIGAPILWAQQTDGTQGPDPQNTQLLLQRIDQLEARLKEVEAALARVQAASLSSAPPQPAAQPQPTAQSQPAAPTPPALAPEPQTESAAGHTETDSMDLNKTLLKIRGFGDVDLRGSSQKHSTTSFALGQVNLFVTSDVSDKFKFLSEVVFEPDQSNVFGVDIERFLLTYLYNDYFNLSVGRYHTSIGYYNTAYHHSTWLQTATGRPFLFNFEDQGGILPIHNVGASLTGRIPSGRLGLHYIAEVGNGRATNSTQSEAVQNLFDENNHKAVNFAVFARPESVPGLQTGFSVYHDLLTPQALPKVGETILDSYVVYNGRIFQWLNEGVLVREAPQGTVRVFNIPGFYTQFSRRFGAYTPYFRYQYVNAPLDGPVFYTNVGLQHGPSAGLRYDMSDFVAWKLQFDHSAMSAGQSFQALAFQVSFTF